MAPALHIVALWKSYTAGVRGCSARVWVLRGLSLTVERGERVAIVGAPAAGKSTLAACILGLCRVDAGVVDAPALRRSELAVVDRSAWLTSPAEPIRQPAATLILTDELACVRSWVDRALVLRYGRLTPLDVHATVRRVAEHEPIEQRAGRAFR